MLLLCNTDVIGFPDILVNIFRSLDQIIGES